MNRNPDTRRRFVVSTASLERDLGKGGIKTFAFPDAPTNRFAAVQESDGMAQIASRLARGMDVQILTRRGTVTFRARS